MNAVIAAQNLHTVLDGNRWSKAWLSVTSQKDEFVKLRDVIRYLERAL